MKIFILEDDVNRIIHLFDYILNPSLHEVTIIKSCEEVNKFQPPYDLILLDHDLGGRQMEDHEDCGMRFLELVGEKINEDALVVLHSYNPDGRRRMCEFVDNLPSNPIYYDAPFGGTFFTTVVKTTERIYVKQEL